MPEVKLFDSERKIMECLWQGGEMSAKELAEELEKTVGWSKPTTYTVLRKCVAKGAVERMEPGFRSADRLVASLLGGKKLSAQEIERMKKLIEELE